MSGPSPTAHPVPPPERAGSAADAFVGREWERAQVAAAIGCAIGGRGELVLISGEAGIGKTRLGREALADAGGCVVAWAACWEGDDGPPYWPWTQVARSLGGMIGADDPTAGPIDRTALSVLTGEHDSEPGWSDRQDPAAGRARLFDAVVQLLEAVTARQPVVVVLDDLHWADEPSLLLLRHVTRRLADLPVAIIATYRDDEVRADSTRSALIGALARGGRAIRLEGLDPDALGGLVAATIDGDIPAGWLSGFVHRTGGNPFFAKEVLRLLAARGGQAGASLDSVPPSVVQVVVQRAARLPQSVGEVLEIAAVLGDRFTIDDIARLGRDQDDVLYALDTAGRAGLVAPTTGGFGFTHALVREAIYENLGPARRARMHHQVGLTLEAADAPAEVLAHHFVAAVPAGDAGRAVAHAVAAGEATLARLAHEDAAAWFERAIALATARDDELTLRALLGRAEVRRRVGDTDAARSDLTTVVAAARRSGNATLLARAALGVQRLGHTSGQVHAEPVELLEDAARALGGDEPDLRALVLSALASELWEHARARGNDARALSLEALELAERAGTPATLARCLEARYTIAWTPDWAGERVQIAERMAEVARASDDTELHATARLLHATALLELADPRWRASLDRFFDLAASVRSPRFDYLVATRRAALAILRGDDNAARLIDDASAVGDRTCEPDAAPVEFYLRWELARHVGTRGELSNARRPRPRTAAVSLAGHVWTPLMLLDAGRLEEARAAFDEAARIPLEEVKRDWIFLNNVFDLAEAAERLSDLEVAARCYETLRRYAGRVSVVSGFVCCCGAVDHHLGALALTLGDATSAREHLRAAVEIQERVGATPWADASRDLLERADAATRVGTGALMRDGKLWRITWQGTESNVPDAKGIRDLAVLLANPGKEIHAAELYGGPTGGEGTSRGAEAVDDTARAAYRARLAELDRDLAEADTDHDLARAERVALERDALIEELRRNFDVKGRSRRLGDTTERARKAVTARIRGAITVIEQIDPDLGAHLRDAIHTGTFCSYQPAEATSWTVR